MYVYIREDAKQTERERESVCVFVCVFVCKRERERETSHPGIGLQLEDRTYRHMIRRVGGVGESRVAIFHFGNAQDSHSLYAFGKENIVKTFVEIFRMSHMGGGVWLASCNSFVC